MAKKQNKKDNYVKDNNINDFSKKNFFETLISGFSILEYKLIIYWLPILLYIFIIIFYITLTQSYSEWSVAFVSSIVIYIIYFLIDFIYQNIICKKSSISKLFVNSLINSIIPAVFIFIGYILAIILRDVRNYNVSYNNNLETSPGFNTVNTDTTKLFNIHRNNIIVSIFFYIFSIIYSNPINKKKCSSNKLC